jgi:glycosyltransferase involved in cell wall biosynthesis
MKVVVVIAAFNEGSTIAQTITSIPSTLEGVKKVDVVVVNDGSQDSTQEEAEKAGAIVLNHSINRGQGAALETGFEYSRHHEYDITVTFDADGQHNGEEINAIIQPILNKEADVVLGSRFIGKKSYVPLGRRVVLKGGVWFTRFFSRIYVTDTHNGFRAFSLKALRKIHLRQDRMAHASEILESVSSNKIQFKEVPVTITYSDYSKAKGQRNGNAVNIVLKMVAHKLTR